MTRIWGDKNPGALCSLRFKILRELEKWNESRDASLISMKIFSES